MNAEDVRSMPCPATGENHRAEILRLERLVRITAPTSFTPAWEDHEKWKQRLRAEKAKSPNDGTQRQAGNAHE